MARLSQGSLNFLKIMTRHGKNTLGRVIKTIRDYGPDAIAGNLINVDTLQMALEGAGFRKGDIGDRYWYRNIVSHFSGYIAELKAVSPDGDTYVFVVESNDGCSIILDVDNVGPYKEEYNKNNTATNTTPDYSQLTIKELRGLCKKKKVKARGTREQLIEHLKWADEHPLVPLTKKEDFRDISTVKDLMGIISLLPEGEDTPITVIEEMQGLYIQILIR